MDERAFELYRLSVVQSMPDSNLKAALIHAIEHKLRGLGAERTPVDPNHRVQYSDSSVHAGVYHAK